MRKLKRKRNNPKMPTLTDQQAQEIKKQILQEIETTFPEDKKEFAKQQLMSMNKEQLFEFIQQNNLIKDLPKENQDQQPSQISPPKTQNQQQCIFCSIVSGQIPSYKIDENKDSIAILELNPISQGHTLIIPKKHLTSSKDLPQTAFSLAKKIAKKLKTRFKPQDITITSSNILGHEIINVFPVFNNETLNSQRQKISEDDLKKLKKALEKKSSKSSSAQKKKPIKKTTKPPGKNKEKIYLPKRIP